MDCTDLYLKINHNLQENIQASLSSSHTHCLLMQMRLLTIMDCGKNG